MLTGIYTINKYEGISAIVYLNSYKSVSIMTSMIDGDELQDDGQSSYG